MKNNHLAIAAMNAATLCHPSSQFASAVLGKSLALTATDLAKARAVLQRMPEDPLASVFTRRDFLLANGWLPAAAAHFEPQNRPVLSVTGVPTVRVTSSGMTMLRKQLERGYAMHSGWGQTAWASCIICRALDWPYDVIVHRDPFGKPAGVCVQRTDVPKLPAKLIEGWSVTVAESFTPQHEHSA